MTIRGGTTAIVTADLDAWLLLPVHTLPHVINASNLHRPKMTPPLATEALVVATYSRLMRLRLPDGHTVIGRVKGKKLTPVCGDRVHAEEILNEPEWLITEILERNNILSRPNARGRPEILAANLTCVAVVVATTPTPDWFILDRYLCAAELMHARPAIIFNKIDLAQDAHEYTQVLQEFQDIGYPVFLCSAKQPDSLTPLAEFLKKHTSIFVGQSGVGKSSLINQLLGEDTQRTGAVSEGSGEGRHTTVNSVMLTLPGGGEVIDSPGVRDFAPAIENQETVALGFREIEKAAQDCRFANCRHFEEPGCGVKKAIASGDISERRYASYRRLLNLTRKFTVDRY